MREAYDGVDVVCIYIIVPASIHKTRSLIQLYSLKNEAKEVVKGYKNEFEVLQKDIY